MSIPLTLNNDEGRRFEMGRDSVVIKVSGNDTGNTYSLMHWTVAPGASVPPHVHNKYEETFYVLKGSMDFLLFEDTIPVSEGDFVRVPAGGRHGYANKSGKPTELLVGFIPGGMEEFFYKYRTDERELDREVYRAEAKTEHGTEYESSS